jgi:hypothetical protein
MNNVGGGSFRAAQEYFQQKTCRFCNQHYTADGIKLLREEPGSLIVKIACSVCGRALGVAIIGTTTEGKRREVAYPPEWTRRDCAKFAPKPPITYDDVLDAHEFFSHLDSDWTKYLPAPAAAGTTGMLDNQAR